MLLRRACLAVLILGPWLGVAGAIAAIHGFLDHHGSVWWVVAGSIAVAALAEVGMAVDRVLKTRPALSRAEVVRRLGSPGLGPFGA